MAVDVLPRAPALNRPRLLRGWCIIVAIIALVALQAAPIGAADKPARRALAPVAPARMPPLPTAIFDDTLAIGGDDIDARKIFSRMTVAVRINDRGPYQFVVDSGADTSVIGLRVARELQLAPGTPVLLNGMTASSQVDRVHIDKLQFGQSTLEDVQLPALDERDLGGDGMIGINALVEQRLMLDFEKRLIKVEDASRPAQHYDGEIVVTAHRRRGQLILTQVSANGRNVEAVVDTGSEITIGSLALRDRLLRRHPERFTTIPVTGVTGVTVNLQMARIDELRLGPIALHDVPIAFADVPPFAVFGLTEQPAMLLGTDILETFRRVSLDFRARKVRFQLRRCKVTGVVLNTTSSTRASRLFSLTDEACRR